MKNILYRGLRIFVAAIFLISCCCSDKKEIKVVFDIPPLIGKNIDQVRAVLGPPPEDSIPQVGAVIDDLYEKDDQMLLVSFNRHSRKVNDFFVGTDDPSGLTADYSDIMKICNARKNGLNYLIIPVRATLDSTKFTGIRIVGK